VNLVFNWVVNCESCHALHKSLGRER